MAESGRAMGTTLFLKEHRVDGMFATRCVDGRTLGMRSDVRGACGSIASGKASNSDRNLTNTLSKGGGNAT